MAASRTAEYVALYRALETETRGRPPLFRDPFARYFLRPPLQRAVTLASLASLRWAFERYADFRAPGARTSAIARTRFIDEVVISAVGAGCEQLVILGAGYDCRAHRIAELQSVRVFEVDRGMTQDAKRSRLVGRGARRDIGYVPIDFATDDLGAAMMRAGWSADGRTIFVWEGVTNYLSEDAVASVLTVVGRAAKDSCIVFTYVHRGVLDGSVHFEDAEQMVENVARLGEPWTFGIDPGALAGFVLHFGLVLEEDLGADEYRARYGMMSRGYAFYRIAVARCS